MASRQRGSVHPLTTLLVKDMEAIGFLVNEQAFLRAMKGIIISLGRLDPKDHDKAYLDLMAKLRGYVDSIESRSGDIYAFTEERQSRSAWMFWSSELYDQYVAILWDNDYLDERKYSFFDPSGDRKSGRRRKSGRPKKPEKEDP